MVVIHAAKVPFSGATPTILSWTAPDDGQLHTVSLSQPLAPVNTSVDAVVDGGTYTIAIKTA